MTIFEKLKKYIPSFTLISLIAYFILLKIGDEYIVRQILFVSIIVGYIPLVVDVFKSIINKNIGVDLLALLSIGGSLLLGEYVAGAIIVLMLSGGELLESYAMKRSRSELSKLINALPTKANIMKDNMLIEVPVDKVKVGDKVTVKPGEVIPTDGIIIDGTTDVDESNITGESLPVPKTIGEKVYSGTISTDATIIVKTTTDPSQSKYQQLIKLVKEAVESKSPFVRLADRYSVWFTAIAITLSLLGYIISGGDFYVVLSVLVVATPCPLILATPIAFSSGVSIAAGRGAIFKSGASIEKLEKLNYIVFDKTGTLSQGNPGIENIEWIKSNISENDKQEFSKIIASIEQFSRHILSKPLIKIHTNILDWYTVENFKEDFGKGVKATVDKSDYVIGSAKYMNNELVKLPQIIESGPNEIKVYFAKNKELVAIITLKDKAKPEAGSVIKSIRDNHGIKIMMLTGDKEEIASKMAKEFSIDKYKAETLPEEKLEQIKSLQDDGFCVGMIGDGVNDAPALAQADVGIALGNLGTSASTEAADIVITSNTLNVLEEIITISDGVMKIAKQGILIGIGLSTILMIIAMFGVLPPTFGALLQEVIDVTVIVNALRTRKIKTKD